MELAGILETVVYCTTENEEETRRFYRDVLGLQPVREEAWGTGSARASSCSSTPTSRRCRTRRLRTAHAMRGSIPASSRSLADYERWKQRLTENGVEIVQEIEWPSRPRSFYFEDPAGNVLEVAEGDMWPR